MCGAAQDAGGQAAGGRARWRIACRAAAGRSASEVRRAAASVSAAPIGFVQQRQVAGVPWQPLISPLRRRGRAAASVRAQESPAANKIKEAFFSEKGLAGNVQKLPLEKVFEIESVKKVQQRRRWRVEWFRPGAVVEPLGSKGSFVAWRQLQGWQQHLWRQQEQQPQEQQPQEQHKQWQNQGQQQQQRRRQSQRLLRVPMCSLAGTPHSPQITKTADGYQPHLVSPERGLRLMAVKALDQVRPHLQFLDVALGATAHALCAAPPSPRTKLAEAPRLRLARRPSRQPPPIQLRSLPPPDLPPPGRWRAPS
jgi:hypothetical protein